MPRLQIQLLGDFAIVCDGKPVPGINATRLQSLLAYLILHRNAPQSREHLAFMFWSDSAEGQALNNLRKALHHLRQKLPEPDHFLQSDIKTIQWNANASYALDVADFEQSLLMARQCDPSADTPGLRAHLIRALSCYQGDLLPSCYDDWVAPRREQLHDDYMAALLRLIALLEQQRDFAAAIQFAHLRLRHDSLSEVAYRHLMQLHISQGDPSSALRVYHACATTLQKELGVSPSELTRDIYRQLLSHDTHTHEPVIPVSLSTKLIGRAAEWQQMQQIWRDAARGQPHLLVIGGEAGIGKTRLVEEFCAWVQQHDVTTVYARAYAAEGALAFAPVATWLRGEKLKAKWQKLDAVWLIELIRVLLEIRISRPDLPMPQPLTENWQRKHLFEALARAVLACNTPLVLVLDDVQWCDRDTLEWLHFLLRFETELPLLVIGGLRSGEVLMDDATDHPLAALLADLRTRQQLSEIELTPLTPLETNALAAQQAERALPENVLSQLYADTQGNPLFVVEVLRAYLNTTTLTLDPQRKPQALPTKVQAVIRSRLLQLSPSARVIASVAATLGREFSTDVLSVACISEIPTDAFVRGLDELWQRRIVREQGTHAYDFSHDRIRDVVAAEVRPARKRLLHRWVADALAQVHEHDLNGVSKQLAAHYDAAGAYAQAVAYYSKAAQVAHAVFALEDEVDLLNHGLSAQAHLPETHAHQVERLSLLLALGQALVQRTGAGGIELRRAYEDAIPLCTLLGQDDDLYRAQHGLWLHYLLLGDAKTANVFASKNLMLGQAKQDNMLMGEAARCLTMTEWMMGQFQAAYLHSEQAVQMIPKQQVLTMGGVLDPSSGSDYLNASAMILWFMGYPDQAVKRNEEGLAFSQALGQPFAEVVALEYLGFMAYFLRKPADAGPVGAKTIEIADKYGFTNYADLGSLHLGWYLANQGKYDEGLLVFQRGLNGCIQSGTCMLLSLYWGMLAEMQQAAGHFRTALGSLEQAFDLAERNGEQFWVSELHRLMGDFCLAQGAAVDVAEAHYTRALDTASQQEAKALELRSATRLARLWLSMGKREQAFQLLHAIYARFTEGFETHDLQQARALLAELQGPKLNDSP